jgi:threonine dehydratase
MKLGEQAGVHLWLKCESLQKTGSFKVRGVVNKLALLGPAERARGVVAVSAGNHAQALAWGASAAGIKCTVCMTKTSSRAKIDASRGYGANVVLCSDVAKAFDTAHELEKTQGFVFVHPFEDEQVVAGAGTVGLEVLEDVPDVEAVIVGIGGGGLIAGIATAIKSRAPSVQVFGVEPTGAASMRMSLDEGHVVHLDKVQTIADGLAPPMAGTLPFDVVRRLVDDVVLVSDEEIADAMKRLITYTKLVAEGAGAAATAALLARKLSLRPGARVVSILSGGNVDAERLKQLL